MIKYPKRRKLPKKLELTLSSVKECQGEYEYERDYQKVLKKLQNTNPFSVLVFYEYSKCSLANLKKLNPNVLERILGFNNIEYNQFYFIPELEEVRVGNYLGSGYRSTQSVYALALALFSETKNVPTHVIIKDNKNIIKHVLSSESLIVQPHEVLQTVDISLAQEILKNTTMAYASRNIKNHKLIDHIFTKKGF